MTVSRTDFVIEEVELVFATARKFFYLVDIFTKILQIYIYNGKLKIERNRKQTFN